jgi:hypothetical protein
MSGSLGVGRQRQASVTADDLPRAKARVSSTAAFHDDTFVGTKRAPKMPVSPPLQPKEAWGEGALAVSGSMELEDLLSQIRSMSPEQAEGLCREFESLGKGAPVHPKAALNGRAAAVLFSVFAQQVGAEGVYITDGNPPTILQIFTDTVNATACHLTKIQGVPCGAGSKVESILHNCVKVCQGTMTASLEACLSHLLNGEECSDSSKAGGASLTRGQIAAVATTVILLVWAFARAGRIAVREESSWGARSLEFLKRVALTPWDLVKGIKNVCGAVWSEGFKAAWIKARKGLSGARGGSGGAGGGAQQRPAAAVAPRRVDVQPAQQPQSGAAHGDSTGVHSSALDVRPATSPPPPPRV